MRLSKLIEVLKDIKESSGNQDPIVMGLVSGQYSGQYTYVKEAGKLGKYCILVGTPPLENCSKCQEPQELCWCDKEIGTVQKLRNIEN